MNRNNLLLNLKSKSSFIETPPFLRQSVENYMHENSFCNIDQKN
jgi:hypothetical protein